MSDAADAAIVRVMLADFANVTDPGSKLNIIGGGIVMMGYDPNIGATAAHAVVAKISFPPEFIGESPAVELALEHDDGSLVTLPGPMGPQFLRVGVADALKPAVVPGANVPPNTVRSSKQFVMYFASGLPLEPNKRYRWRIKIDHETRDEWTETFYVFTADAGPVIG
ncbi:hypothetical protein [Mycobacterium gastri]|uniref:Uncharacterized protein n=1 Tax=Mycobacterium gastri TaxID=1777 RepID=A0A1X1V8J7_MYCGS|nr:hypothetical protein [Mycobacterium gastri]ETW25866.1 hypothetical protein MGAST_00270 [Mycobacterium gastri 'Wayne']ORV65383.1 hypothetical protein AWC07_13650 [Mycobacterium gastri]